MEKEEDLKGHPASVTRYKAFPAPQSRHQGGPTPPDYARTGDTRLLCHLPLGWLSLLTFSSRLKEDYWTKRGAKNHSRQAARGDARGLSTEPKGVCSDWGGARVLVLLLSAFLIHAASRQGENTRGRNEEEMREIRGNIPAECRRKESRHTHDSGKRADGN